MREKAFEGNKERDNLKVQMNRKIGLSNALSQLVWSSMSYLQLQWCCYRCTAAQNRGELFHVTDLLF